MILENFIPIALDILFALALLLAVYAIILAFRNNKVFTFRIFLTNAIYGYLLKTLDSYKDDSDYMQHKEEYTKLRLYLWSIKDRYSYARMLFHYKPLKLKHWYDKDEIAMIKEGYEYYLEEELKKKE